MWKLFSQRKSEEDPSFKRHTVIADIEGFLSIMVPKSSKIDPLASQKDNILKLLEKNIFSDHEGRDFSLDILIEIWTVLSYLGSIDIREKDNQNVFSSNVFGDKAYAGEGQIAIFDTISLKTPLNRHQFSFNKSYNVSDGKEGVTAIVNIKSSILIEPFPVMESHTIGRSPVSTFKSSLFDGLYGRYHEFRLLNENKGGSTSSHLSHAI